LSRDEVSFVWNISYLLKTWILNSYSFYLFPNRGGERELEGPASKRFPSEKVFPFLFSFQGSRVPQRSLRLNFNAAAEVGGSRTVPEGKAKVVECKLLLDVMKQMEKTTFFCCSLGLISSASSLCIPKLKISLDCQAADAVQTCWLTATPQAVTRQTTPPCKFRCVGIHQRRSREFSSCQSSLVSCRFSHGFFGLSTGYASQSTRRSQARLLPNAWRKAFSVPLFASHPFRIGIL
jgi:hypothetical protein